MKLKYFGMIVFAMILVSSMNVSAQSTRVISTNPKNGDVDIPTDLTEIKLVFSNLVDTTDWEEKISMKTTAGYETNRIIGFSLTDLEYIIYLDRSLLSENTQYSISLWGFEDSNGNPIENYTFSFKTQSESSKNEPSPQKTSMILITSLIILIVIAIMILMTLLIRMKSKNKVLEGLKSDMKKAILTNDPQKAAEIYNNARTEFDKLSDSVKERHYDDLIGMYDQVFRMSLK